MTNQIVVVLLELLKKKHNNVQITYLGGNIMKRNFFAVFVLAVLILCFGSQVLAIDRPDLTFEGSINVEAYEHLYSVVVVNSGKAKANYDLEVLFEVFNKNGNRIFVDLRYHSFVYLEPGESFFSHCIPGPVVFRNLEKHSFKVTIDPYGMESESDESNNIITLGNVPLSSLVKAKLAGLAQKLSFMR